MLFWNYFSLNFDFFGLKRLISTYYNPIGHSYKIEKFDINGEILYRRTFGKHLCFLTLIYNNNNNAHQSKDKDKECLDQQHSNDNETNLNSLYNDVLKENIQCKWNECINLNSIDTNCFDDIHIKKLQFNYIDREEDIINAIQLVIQNESEFNI